MGTHPIFESDFDCLTELNMSTERTFIAIKPDGVQRGLVGKIIKRFEQRGFKLVAMKLCMPGKEHLENHYADLKSKPFFAGLVEYMNSGPICAMVWEGLNVVKMGRMMLGETNPQDQSEETSQSRSDETSATAQTRLSPPTTRSAFGSNPKNSSLTIPVPPPGSTSKSVWLTSLILAPSSEILCNFSSSTLNFSLAQ